MQSDNNMEFYEWLRYGVSMGWISEPSCAMHDWFPMTEEEDKRVNEGFDPCVFGVRVWELS